MLWEYKIIPDMMYGFHNHTLQVEIYPTRVNRWQIKGYGWVMNIKVTLEFKKL